MSPRFSSVSDSGLVQTRLSEVHRRPEVLVQAAAFDHQLIPYRRRSLRLDTPFVRVFAIVWPALPMHISHGRTARLSPGLLAISGSAYCDCRDRDSVDSVSAASLG